MSLRTRLLVGLGVVALVLGGVAVAVTRSAEGYLVGQVDDRLPTHVDDQWDRGGRRANGPATDPTPSGGPPLSPYYVGVVDGDSVAFVQDPDVRDPGGDEADAPAPDIDADQARRAAAAGEDGDVFTVGSDSADRYRVRAIEENGQVWVVATSLADVDAAVSRLVTVEVVAHWRRARPARPGRLLGGAPRRPAAQVDGPHGHDRRQRRGPVAAGAGRPGRHRGG